MCRRVLCRLVDLRESGRALTATLLRDIEVGGGFEEESNVMIAEIACIYPRFNNTLMFMGAEVWCESFRSARGFVPDHAGTPLVDLPNPQLLASPYPRQYPRS